MTFLNGNYDRYQFLFLLNVNRDNVTAVVLL